MCLNLEIEEGKFEITSQPGFEYNSGNDPPFEGFGHLAFIIKSVHETYEYLTSEGVTFQQTPFESAWENAKAYDPNGVYVQLITRGNDLWSYSNERLLLRKLSQLIFSCCCSSDKKSSKASKKKVDSKKVALKEKTVKPIRNHSL